MGGLSDKALQKLCVALSSNQIQRKMSDRKNSSSIPPHGRIISEISFEAALIEQNKEQEAEKVKRLKKCPAIRSVSTHRRMEMKIESKKKKCRPIFSDASELKENSSV
jgi:hypothetical protein